MDVCGYVMPRSGEECARRPGHNGKHLTAAAVEAKKSRDTAYNATRAAGTAPEPAGKRPHQWPLDDLLAAVDGELDVILDGGGMPGESEMSLLMSVVKKARQVRNMHATEPVTGRPGTRRTVEVRGSGA